MKKLFSLIAIAGVLAACQPESIETTFVVDNAVATIEVTCVDLATGATVTPTLSATGGAVVDGQKVTLTGNPSIGETVITITADYQKGTFSKDVKINPCKGGAEASYKVPILVGEIAGDWKVTAEDAGSVDSDPIHSTFTPTSHSFAHSYTHDGIDFTEFFENPTEFALDVKISYNQYEGFEVADSDVKVLVDAFADQVMVALGKLKENKNIQGIKEVPSTFESTVSAWSLFAAYADLVKTTQSFNIVATNSKGFKQTIATVDIHSKNVSEVNILEIAHPNHASHYVAGHGHASHGHGGDNAGGGIAFAE